MMSKTVLMSLNKQEEKLKFIDSLLASNHQNGLLVNSYDFRNDILKFISAKERIIDALVYLKQNSTSRTGRLLNVGTLNLMI